MGAIRGQSWGTGTTNGDIWREQESVYKEPARSLLQFGLLVCDRVNKELLYLDRLQPASLNTLSNIGDEGGIAALDVALGAKVIRHAETYPKTSELTSSTVCHRERSGTVS